MSIPAPVHYAHLAAGTARAYKFGDRNSPNAQQEYVLPDQHRCMKWSSSPLIFSDEELDEEADVGQMSLEDIKSKVMLLNESIQNTLYFV